MLFAGWVNRHQSDVIDYLQEENRLLKERLGEQSGRNMLRCARRPQADPEFAAAGQTGTKSAAGTPISAQTQRQTNFCTWGFHLR
jgi:hypothetical protein